MIQASQIQDNSLLKIQLMQNMQKIPKMRNFLQNSWYSFELLKLIFSRVYIEFSIAYQQFFAFYLFHLLLFTIDAKYLTNKLLNLKKDNWRIQIFAM